eukprot:6743820-Pyramimonas_sp.AAC.1
MAARARRGPPRGPPRGALLHPAPLCTTAWSACRRAASTGCPPRFGSGCAPWWGTSARYTPRRCIRTSRWVGLGGHACRTWCTNESVYLGGGIHLLNHLLNHLLRPS